MWLSHCVCWARPLSCLACLCVCAFSVAPLNWLLTGRQDKQISQQLYELAAFFHNVAHTCLFDNFVDILPFSHRWGSEKWNLGIMLFQFANFQVRHTTTTYSDIGFAKFRDDPHFIKARMSTKWCVWGNWSINTFLGDDISWYTSWNTPLHCNGYK